MRHGKMGRHVDTAGHGHGNLLVLLVACRWLGAHHQLSVLLRLESLRALVVCFIASFTVPPTTQGLSLWCFTHSGGRDFDHPRHSHYSGVIPRWCFNIVGGDILTIPDTPTTQGLSLWCFGHSGRSVPVVSLVPPFRRLRSLTEADAAGRRGSRGASPDPGRETSISPDYDVSLQRTPPSRVAGVRITSI
jgi:hypothetical protein